MSIVIDPSDAIRLCERFSTGLGSDAISVARQGLVAPPMFWFEVASGLRNMTLRQGLAAADRFFIMDAVRSLDVSVEAPSPRVEPVITVSDRYQLTVYDAAHLELAIRTGAGLATRDKGLLSAAARAGVQLVGAP